MKDKPTAKDLLNFIKSLEQKGLLVKSTEELDYEKVIFDYINYDVDYSGTVIMVTKK
jgi:hypothetical protein